MIFTGVDTAFRASKTFTKTSFSIKLSLASSATENSRSFWTVSESSKYRGPRPKPKCINVVHELHGKKLLLDPQTCDDDRPLEIEGQFF